MVRLRTIDTLLNPFTQRSRTSSFPSSVVLMITVRESYMCMTVIHQYESAAKMFYQMVFVRYSAHKVTFCLKRVKKSDMIKCLWHELWRSCHSSMRFLNFLENETNSFWVPWDFFTCFLENRFHLCVLSRFRAQHMTKTTRWDFS